MPGYLLDTNILSDLVHNPRSGTAGRQLALLRAHGGQEISTSIIAAAELRYGVARRGSTRLADIAVVVDDGVDVRGVGPADTQQMQRELRAGRAVLDIERKRRGRDRKRALSTVSSATG
jgi:predicted nucleic acid-binding protein